MSQEAKAYGEPLKRRARSTVLRHAIEALTSGRESSSLVTVSEFDRMLQYCIRFIKKHAHRDLSEEMSLGQEYWHDVHASRVGLREASDLRVLFLCGPEPLNDLEELASLGIAPHNVWAVEGDRACFEAAVKQLHEAGMSTKLHFGSLHEFFSVVPEQFDVVYFDACGPLFGGKPKTNIVLRELFLNQRMAPLSALITNFAATPRENEEAWVKRLFAWYAPRYFQPVYHESEEIERVNGEKNYDEHIKTHLEAFYSDFVSRFTIEFATQLLPWWRVRGFPAARRTYFAEEQKLKSAIDAAFVVAKKGTPMQQALRLTGHGQLSPSSYPYLWMVNLVRKQIASGDPFKELVLNDTVGGAKLFDAVSAVTLVRNYFEGYVDWGKHNWEACSDEMGEVLGKFRWADSPGGPLDRFFCDTPLPNLIVDLLIGVYGYPYHVNLQKLRRLAYRAKQTTMYSDVFILDQCRYLYDLVPTLPLFGSELPLGLQLLIRTCIDLVRRHTHRSCWDLFRGGALAGEGEEGFGNHTWPDRRELTEA